MPLIPGTKLGPYEIVGPLGAGGMGEVYEARDTRLDRRVALKVLPHDVASDPESLARLEREAKAVAALNHPNIVTLHGLEEAAGMRYLVMERVPGRPLSALIPAGGLPAGRILELAVPIADALAAAHENGVVHRDLKPANVMVSDEGRVKVLDFGLARRSAPPGSGVETQVPTDALTEQGRVFGTIPYMAPEQLRGERVDARADLFSFGAMVYEMASGRRPFLGNSAPDVMSAILREEPPPLGELKPGLPPAFTRIVQRCLEKDPRRRLQSAVDLHQELCAVADELRTGPSTAPSIPRAVAGAPRGRVRPILAVGAALLVTAVVALLVPLVRKSRPAPPGFAPITSVAVLPFENLAHDPSQEYFVEGMHDELITDLAKLGTLRVTSRSTVMRYKGQTKPMKEIARELGVDAVIEGSVLKAGNRVRITAQLIRGLTDEHVWAESYDRDLADVLRLLADVSQSIAGEVQATVARGSRPPLPSPAATPPRVRPEAWEAYLRGRHVLLQGSFSPADLRASLEPFRQAVALDPGFSLGWSGVATTEFLLAFFQLAPVRDVLPRAREAAERAVALDDRSGEGYGILGSIELYFDWDFGAARRHLERGVALDPHSFLIRHAWADYLMCTGRTEESLEQVKVGLASEPTSPVAQLVVMFHTETTHRYEEVVAQGRRLVAAYPGFAMVHGNIGKALWKLGRYGEAMDEYRIVMGDSEAFRLMERAYRAGGPKAAMKARADAAAARFEPGKGNPLAVAGGYAQAAESALAFEWLEKAFAERSPQILHVVADTAFDGLRADPRYKNLLRRIGLPAAPAPH